MASITAAVGGGNWTTGASWVGGVAPGTGDDALLAATSGNITIDSGGAVCRSLDCNTYTGTLTHNSAATLTIGDATAGLGGRALRLVSGMTYTLNNASTSALNFVTTNLSTQTVTTAGKTLGNVTLTLTANNSCIIQLADGLTVGSTATLTHSAGTFDVNAKTCSWGFFSSIGTNTRTFTTGAATIAMTGINAGLACFNLTSTGLTFTAGSSTINFTGNSQGLTAAGRTFGTITISGDNVFTITGGATIATLTRTASGTQGNGLSFNNPTTITGTLTVTGTSQTNRMFVRTATTAGAIAITAAAVSLTNVDFCSITAAGVASPFTGTSIGDGGGNTNITANSPVTRFWVGNGGNFSNTAHWSTSSGGTSGASMPLPQDTVIFDSNSITTTSQTIVLDIQAVPALDFTNVLNSPGLTQTSTGNQLAQFYLGNLNLTGIGTFTSVQCLYAKIGTMLLTSAGNTFSTMTMNNTNSSGIQLQDALTCGAFILNTGTFDTNGKNMTCLSASITVGFSFTRAMTMGSTVLTITQTSGTPWNATTVLGLTFTAGTSRIVYTGGSASSKTFAGGGLTYYTVNFSGSGSGVFIMSGSNTFNDTIVIDTPPHTIQFTNGTTQTFLNPPIWSGVSGSLVTITSDTTATHSLVYSGAGLIGSDYMNIQHSVATPSNTWYAGNNSTNNQAVATAGSGWIFTGAPMITQQDIIIIPPKQATNRASTY